MKYRARFRVSLLLAAVGGVWSWYALGPLPRAAAGLLLLVSAALLVVSAHGLHRHRHGRSYLRHAAVAYAPHAVVGLLLLVGLRLWLVLAPPGQTAITSLAPDALRARMAIDAQRLAALSAASPGALQRLAQELARQPPDPAATRAAWRAFMTLAARYDDLVQTYQGFYRIDVVTQRALHADAFVLGMCAYAQDYILLSETAAWLENAAGARALLDGHDPLFGPRTCTRLMRSLASDKPLLRLNAGAAYLELVRPDCSPGNPLVAELDRDLTRARATAGQTTVQALADPLRRLRRLGRLRAWFPLPRGQRLPAEDDA